MARNGGNLLPRGLAGAFGSGLGQGQRVFGGQHICFNLFTKRHSGTRPIDQTCFALKATGT